MNLESINYLKNIVGNKGWLEDKFDLNPYLTEERGIYKGNSNILLKPSNTLEVSKIVKFCSKNLIPIVPQGGRTGLCGGAVPSNNGTEVIVSMERMNKIKNIDVENFTLSAEAGCILHDLQASAKNNNRFFLFILASEGTCTIGGNLSTNAGGINVLKYGMARDLVLGLEVVLPNGNILDRLTGLRKDNRGYDLKQLFVGAEGTLGIITSAVVKLFSYPRKKETALIAIDNPKKAVDFFSYSVEKIGDLISAFELNSSLGMNLVKKNIENINDFFTQNYPWYVLIEVSSSYDNELKKVFTNILSNSLQRNLILDAIVAQNESQRTEMWKTRENLNEAQKREGLSLKHDISIPISKVAQFINDASHKVKKYFPESNILAFGHIGDGNIHFNVGIPKYIKKTKLDSKSKQIKNIVFETVNELKGSISAEHGIGKLKKEDLVKYSSSEEIKIMQLIKATLDPRNIMNPGKIL